MATGALPGISARCLGKYAVPADTPSGKYGDTGLICLAMRRPRFKNFITCFCAGLYVAEM